jgi:arylsulfatase A-like enzyme
MNQSLQCVHPNLLYVFSDQLRYDSCSFTGDPRARTPNMAQLASQGVSFSNAVSGHPLCAPYRASLLTGKYGSSTGMAISELRMNPNHECLGHVLGREGYDTAYIGKWHLWGASADSYGTEREQFVPPGPYRLGFDGYWAATNSWHEYQRSFYYEDEPQPIPMQGYEPDVQTDLAIRWIREGRDEQKPFALVLSDGTPHDPWRWDNVPEEYAAMYRDVDFPLPPNYADGSGEYWHPDMTHEWWMMNVSPHVSTWMQIYYAMVANLDWNLGRLLRALDVAGLREDTVVVFTSDHGEMLGAHGRIAKNTFYEEACHVPFLIRWPGRTQEDYVSEACLATPDIMPTVLWLLGLPVPLGVEGQDLSQCALGQPCPEPAAAFMQGLGHTFLWLDGYEWRALRDKRYTYAIMRADSTEYLFDNLSDPFQMHNLVDAPHQAETLRRFRALLKERMRELGDTFPACTWYRDRWADGRVIRAEPRMEVAPGTPSLPQRHHPSYTVPACHRERALS